MKDKNVQPIDQKKVMREDDFIVSKTDPKGRIIVDFYSVRRKPSRHRRTRN